MEGGETGVQSESDPVLHPPRHPHSHLQRQQQQQQHHSLCSILSSEGRPSVYSWLQLHRRRYDDDIDDAFKSGLEPG